jgi:hypothetical protein
VGEREGEEGTQLGGFSRGKWTPKMDVDAFPSILFEILIGRSGKRELSFLSNNPAFLSTMIKSGLDPTPETRYSFDVIFEILKRNDFRIDDDVDSVEVSAFVNWVESAEQPEK